MQYSLILMDFSMPQMDGVTATKQIREIWQGQIDPEDGRIQPAIIGLTGHVGDKFKKQGMAAGMDDLLYKPLYNNVLKSLLEKHELIN